MADHPTRADIDLLDGGFYVDDPHADVRVDARQRAGVLRRAAHGVWGFASLRRGARRVEGPEDVLERGRHPARQRADPDDDRHGRSRALEAAQARQPRLHARAACATASRRSATSRRDHRHGVRAGECDFVRDIAAPLPMIMIGDMLGVAPEDRDDLLRWSDDMVSAQSGSATEEQYVAAMNAMTEYTEFCTHAVAQRQANPTDDLMSVLVHAEVDGDRLDARRRAARVAAHPHRRRRDDAPRHQRRHGAAAAAPRPARSCCSDDPDEDPGRGRGDAALGEPDQEHVPHGHARHRVHGPAAARRARSACCSTSRRTATRPSSTTRTASTSSASRTSTSRSASARTSASARRSPGSSSA